MFVAALHCRAPTSAWSWRQARSTQYRRARTLRPPPTHTVMQPQDCSSVAKANTCMCLVGVPAAATSTHLECARLHCTPWSSQKLAAALQTKRECLRLPAAETSTHLESACASRHGAAASLLDQSDVCIRVAPPLPYAASALPLLLHLRCLRCPPLHLRCLLGSALPPLHMRCLRCICVAPCCTSEACRRQRRCTFTPAAQPASACPRASNAPSRENVVQVWHQKRRSTLPTSPTCRLLNRAFAVCSERAPISSSCSACRPPSTAR